MLNLGESALVENHIQERLSLDCEELCSLIQATRNKVFTWADKDNPSSAVKAYPIDKQHDYDLLLVTSEVSQGYSSAQRWRLRLGTSGIVKCETKKVDWPSPEEQMNRKAIKSLRNRFRKR